jgi:hypothetical protein
VAVMEVEEFVVDVFDVVRMPADELDELFMASGDGRREFREEDGNRLGRGDMGAIGGAEVEFAFELPAKSEGVSLLLLLLFSFGLCFLYKNNTCIIYLNFQEIFH